MLANQRTAKKLIGPKKQKKNKDKYAPFLTIS